MSSHTAEEEIRSETGEAAFTPRLTRQLLRIMIQRIYMIYRLLKLLTAYLFNQIGVLQSIHHSTRSLAISALLKVLFYLTHSVYVSSSQVGAARIIHTHIPCRPTLLECSSQT